MMRKTNLIIFSIAVIVFAGTFLLSLISFPPEDQNTRNQNELSSYSHSDFKVPKSGVHTFMGKSESEIRKTFGEPERIDETKYGYSWFIYGRGSEKYIQIGIDRQTHKVTTIYALGDQLKTAPFAINDHARQIYQKVPISDTVSLDYKGTNIEFELNEEDLMIRPLVKFGKNWVQLNFDHIADQLVGVRYLSSEVLALQTPYSMIYKGKLPEGPNPTDSEWEQINQAEDQEILDISNILRMRFDQKPLKWNESAHQAAYKHSREMQQKNYFSHDSRWSGDLRARIEREGIAFQTIGENIAAKYPDAIAVTLGWLNSADHRENLLNQAFLEIGVGSYKNYYTQDFVTPINP